MAGIRCYAFFNLKAAKWIAGRKNWRAAMREKLRSGERRIWVHCSSLGEYEQGKPLMEALRNKYPKYKIVLTFFSPSGYEAYGSQHTADYVFYLPPDSRANARDFIKMVDPLLTIFIKYEFWYHYIHTLAVEQRQMILVSATFRQNQAFFKWYGGLFRSLVRAFTFVFVQDQDSVSLLKTIGMQDKVIRAGDTRYDRVAEIARNSKPLPAIEKFLAGQKVLIAGSTWLEDERILKQCISALPKQWKIIIAPHEVSVAHIRALSTLFSGEAVLHSDLAHNAFGMDSSILIINNIGMLASLYAYADIAMVGGGFAKGGVHNVLEPAIYGVPIIIGPVFEKYVEARELLAENLINTVRTADDCAATLKYIANDDNYRRDIKARLQVFMQEHAGSTEKIMQRIDLES